MKIVYRKNAIKKSKRVATKTLQDNMAKLIVEWTKTGKLGEVDLDKVHEKSATRDKSEIGI